jgi:peptide/nickel transport system permease protein
MRGLTKGYVARRLFMFLLTIWLGATVLFIIPRLAPGDPISAMVARLSQRGQNVENADAMIAAWKAEFGLDDPMHVQYVRYFGRLLTGDLGYSLAFFPERVNKMVRQALPWTVALLLTAALMSFGLGTLIGALLGWRDTRPWLRRMLPVTLIFTSVPYFMLAILLIFIFAFTLGWLPASGGYGRGIEVGPNLPFAVDALKHALLPAFSIVIATMGFWALGMRGMMITTAGEDYINLARIKGLPGRRIFLNYAVRNAILPQVTSLALTLGSIVAGSILVEYLFAYPGMGFLMYRGLSNQDFTLISGVGFVLIVTSATAVLIIDLIYPLIDPRITYAKK